MLKRSLSSSGVGGSPCPPISLSRRRRRSARNSIRWRMSGNSRATTRPPTECSAPATNIVDRCCHARDRLAAQPWTIMSVGLCQRAWEPASALRTTPRPAPPPGYVPRALHDTVSSARSRVSVISRRHAPAAFDSSTTNEVMEAQPWPGKPGLAAIRALTHKCGYAAQQSESRCARPTPWMSRSAACSVPACASAGRFARPRRADALR